MMYMDSRYEGSEVDPDLVVFDLRLTDDASLIDSTSTENYPTVYGGLRTPILSWAGSSSVTVEERYRNEWVSCFQGNRNVFVDVPGLACERYGGLACGPATTGAAATAGPTCNASRPAGPDEAWCTTAAAILDELWESVADRADLAELLSDDACPGAIDDWLTPCLFATGERAADTGRAVGTCGPVVATLSASKEGTASTLHRVAEAAVGVGADGLVGAAESISITFSGVPVDGSLVVRSVVLVGLPVDGSVNVSCGSVSAAVTGVSDDTAAAAVLDVHLVCPPGTSLTLASVGSTFALAAVGLNASLALPPTTLTPAPAGDGGSTGPAPPSPPTDQLAPTPASPPSPSSTPSSADDTSSTPSATLPLPLPLIIVVTIVGLLLLSALGLWIVVRRPCNVAPGAGGGARRTRRSSTIRRTYASVAAALEADDDGGL
jgi:hypothetical protein